MVLCPVCGWNTPEGTFCEHCGNRIVTDQARGQSPDDTSEGDYYSGTRYADGDSPFAGFWIRFVAWLIDAVIIGLVFFIIVFFVFAEGGIDTRQVSGRYSEALNTVMWLVFLLTTAFYWVYSAGFESSHKQATIGKQVCGLMVTDKGGKRLSFRQATIRWIGKLFSGWIFCLGFIIIGFTERKQGLHDILALTYVVYKNRMT